MTVVAPARPRRRKANWTQADLLRFQRRQRPSGPSLHLPGGILSLDLSGVVGWAYGTVDDADPLTGAWVLPGGAARIGQRYAAYENELIDAIARHRPSLVVMEAPMRLHAQMGRNEAAARQQFGLAAYTEGECYRARVELAEADVDHVRKVVLGRSRWPNRSQVKPAIVAWCQSMGWSVPDHNAADACLLWTFACQQQRSRARP